MNCHDYKEEFVDENKSHKAKEVTAKIISAINMNRLKLTEGERPWRNFVISITELVWARNLHDGYLIHVHDHNSKHLTTLTI
ncbi:MAG: hypothetical protein V3V74_07340 [Nitrosomonadaceae bacterium]